MVAQLYIIAESFSQNVNSTNEEIEAKIQLLGNDFVSIRKYKETNKILVHPGVYEMIFINNFAISDLIYNNEIANENLDRDSRIMLKTIILESQTTDYSSEDVIEVLLSEHNEDLCHGLIGFNAVHGVGPDYQIVYDLHGWLNFRRYFLSIYPKNPVFFIEECEKYFPNLYFHERNKTAVGAILQDCPKKIIYHLRALNDIFKSISAIGLNRTQLLEQFSITAQLDETASLEGNPVRKGDFTFGFINTKENIENVCCEPHLKLCYSDIPGDNTYSNNRRIYFHEGISNIEDGKILIGHIGTHL